MAAASLRLMAYQVEKEQCNSHIIITPVYLKLYYDLHLVRSQAEEATKMTHTARVLLATLHGGKKAPIPSSKLATCKAGSRSTLTISLALETTLFRFSFEVRAFSTPVRAFDITASAYSILSVTL